MITNGEPLTITPPDWQAVATSLAMHVAAAEAHLAYANGGGCGLYNAKQQLSWAMVEVRRMSVPTMLFSSAKPVSP